ncbi:MAG: RtcB family protein [Hafnia sp.]
MGPKIVMREDGARPIRIWAPEVEDSALVQLKNLARLPFIAKHGVAAMPDVHAGYGSTVGSVIATDKAIIPSAVGVDIGCGMIAIRISIKASDLPDNLKRVRMAIEKAVPLGKGGAHNEDTLQQNVKRLPVASARTKHVITEGVFAEQGWDAAVKKAASQLGSLGAGNHFIELCIDENQDVWVMLHSGSRGIGNMIGSYFIERGKKLMEKFFITLPDGDLAFLPENTEDFDDYVAAVQWAQDYALENRKHMMENVLAVLAKHIEKPFAVTAEAINCHHNYVEKENHFGQNLWVTRKGAIRAREGDMGIIPGSMGQRSYIVRGKGNLESYCSCSHGAGRVMSRKQAQLTFTVQDLKEQTKGVECRKDKEILDESPMAYKNIDEVMANQTDLVEVVHILKQVLCVKGT